MPALHLIEHLAFEIGYADEATAWEHAQRLQQFAAGPATAVIAAVFDEIDDGDAVLRWDALELDLGVLASDAPDAAWAEQLRKALRDALGLAAGGAQHTPAAGARGTAGASVRSRQEDDFEQLWCWLQHGHLPWQAGAADAPGEAVDRLAARLLDEQAPALVQALQRAPERERLLERLALQWPLPLLERLAQALAAPAPGAAMGAMPATAAAHDGTAGARRRWLLHALVPGRRSEAAAAALSPCAPTFAITAAPASAALAAHDTAQRTAGSSAADGASEPNHAAGAGATLATAVDPAPDASVGSAPGGAPTSAPEPAAGAVDLVTAGLHGQPGMAAASAAITRLAASVAAQGPVALRRLALPLATWRSLAAQLSGADRVALVQALAPAASLAPTLAAAPAPARHIVALAEAAARQLHAGPLDAPRATAEAWACVLHRLAAPPAQRPDTRAAWLDVLATDLAAVAAPGGKALRQALAAAWPAPGMPPTPVGSASNGAPVTAAATGDVDRPVRQSPARQDTAPTAGDLALRSVAARAGDAVDAADVDADADADADATTPHLAPRRAGGRATPQDMPAHDRETAVPTPWTMPSGSAAPAAPFISGAAVAPAPAGAAAVPAPPQADAGVAQPARPDAPPRFDVPPATAAEIVLAVARCLDLLALASVRAGLLRDVDVLRGAGAALLTQALAADWRSGGLDLAEFVRRWLALLPPLLAATSAGQAEAATTWTAARPLHWQQRLAHALRSADAAPPHPGPPIAIVETRQSPGPSAPTTTLADAVPDTGGHRLAPIASPVASPVVSPAVWPAVSPAGAPAAAGSVASDAMPGEPRAGGASTDALAGRENRAAQGRDRPAHDAATVPAAGAIRRATSAVAGPEPVPTVETPRSGAQGPAPPQARPERSALPPRPRAAADGGHDDADPDAGRSAATTTRHGAKGVDEPAAENAAAEAAPASPACMDGSATQDAPPGVGATTDAAHADDARPRPAGVHTGPEPAHAANPRLAASAHPLAALAPPRTTAAPGADHGTQPMPASLPSPPAVDTVSAMPAVGTRPDPATALRAPTTPAAPPTGRPAREVLDVGDAQLRQRLADLVAAAGSPPAVRTAARPAAARPSEADPPGETIYIGNAGLVLASPYLPRLLTRLGLLADDRFVDEAAARRAVQVLQVLVDGRLETPEHRLALNKLLCGVALPTPVPREIALSEAEQQTITGLLQALISHWAALGRTSVAGLRASFLQREGALGHDDEGWRLRVQARPFDMLLDRLPWGFRTCRFPWMDEVLHVDWR